ncbi:hypothetical protein TRAPUB_6000 [Trametes pubescens]|uniref:Uncharacterized protein n=1 Tax=Trametes pubescens TaxID=154538 RepID=A0A1M2V743_TRAPU|nr:hypothetical protein TRAPUB_6000 [Trametes pubescens]
MAEVPMGCTTDAKPAAPGWKIHLFQSASEPPSPLSGTVSRPGKISLTDSVLRHCVSESLRCPGEAGKPTSEGY